MLVSVAMSGFGAVGVCMGGGWGVEGNYQPVVF